MQKPIIVDETLTLAKFKRNGILRENTNEIKRECMKTQAFSIRPRRENKVTSRMKKQAVSNTGTCLGCQKKRYISKESKH